MTYNRLHHLQRRRDGAADVLRARRREGRPIYGFVDDDAAESVQAAWDKGVDCILKCQVKVDGKLTVWCAQHDEKDFSPQPARDVRAGVAERMRRSIGLVHVLMAVEKPSAASRSRPSMRRQRMASSR